MQLCRKLEWGAQRIALCSTPGFRAYGIVLPHTLEGEVAAEAVAEAAADKQKGCLRRPMVGYSSLTIPVAEVKTLEQIPR